MSVQNSRTLTLTIQEFNRLFQDSHLNLQPSISDEESVNPVQEPPPEAGETGDNGENDFENQVMSQYPNAKKGRNGKWFTSGQDGKNYEIIPGEDQ